MCDWSFDFQGGHYINIYLKQNLCETFWFVFCRNIFPEIDDNENTEERKTGWWSSPTQSVSKMLSSLLSSPVLMSPLGSEEIEFYSAIWWRTSLNSVRFWVKNSQGSSSRWSSTIDPPSSVRIIVELAINK